MKYILLLLFVNFITGAYVPVPSHKVVKIIEYEGYTSSMVSHKKCDESIYNACIFENPNAYVSSVSSYGYTYNYNITVTSTDCVCHGDFDSICDNKISQIYTMSWSSHDQNINMNCIDADYCHWDNNYNWGDALDNNDNSKIYVKVKVQENKTCNVTVHWKSFDRDLGRSNVVILIDIVLILCISIVSCVAAYCGFKYGKRREYQSI